MAPRSPIRGPRSIHFSSPERKSAFATNAWVGVTRSGGPPPDVTRPSAQRYKGDRGKSGSGHTVSGQVGDRGCACHREDGSPGEETGRADARLDHGQPDTDDYHSTALRLVPVAERQLRRSIRGRGLIGRDPRREGRPPSDVDHPPGPAPLPRVPPTRRVPPIDTTARGAGVRVAGVRVAGGRGFGGGGTSVSATRPIACGAPAGRQMVGGPSGAPGRSRRDRVRSPTVGGPAPASDSDGRARQPHGHVCVHEGFSLGWRLRAQPPPAGGTVIGPVERAGGPRRSGTPTRALGSRVGEAPPRSATCLREGQSGEKPGWSVRDNPRVASGVRTHVSGTRRVDGPTPSAPAAEWLPAPAADPVAPPPAAGAHGSGPKGRSRTEPRGAGQRWRRSAIGQSGHRARRPARGRSPARPTRQSRAGTGRPQQRSAPERSERDPLQTRSTAGAKECTLTASGVRGAAPDSTDAASRRDGSGLAAASTRWAW